MAEREHEGQPKPRTEILRLKVNGTWHEFKLGHDVFPFESLGSLLREKVGCTGLKIACNEGACGACTVLEDDDPVVKAFAEQCEPGFGTTMQCGYCTPGFVMATKGLLNENPDPTPEEIRDGLSGNLCRCGCYAAIGQAVLRASKATKDKGKKT
jgi:aerobic-type carbon monoxide dehydrogenase small subunit (CoxS/CutS family)